MSEPAVLLVDEMCVKGDDMGEDDADEDGSVPIRSVIDIQTTGAEVLMQP